MKFYRMRCPRCAREAFTKLPPIIRGKLTCGHCASSQFRIELIDANGPPEAPETIIGKPSLRCDHCGISATTTNGHKEGGTHYRVRKAKDGRALSANECGKWAMLLAALVLSALARPARAQPWNPPTRIEAGVLVAAELAIAADLVQTISIVRLGLPETNPFLGHHPSALRASSFIAASMLATGLLWYALPAPWRDLVVVEILAVEAVQIAGNIDQGVPFVGTGGKRAFGLALRVRL